MSALLQITTMPTQQLVTEIQRFYSSTALEPGENERQGNLGLRRVGYLICHKIAEKRVTVLCYESWVIHAQGLSPTLAYF